VPCMEASSITSDNASQSFVSFYVDNRASLGAEHSALDLHDTVGAPIVNERSGQPQRMVWLRRRAKRGDSNSHESRYRS
jgi:hypothetical protein